MKPKALRRGSLAGRDCRTDFVFLGEGRVMSDRIDRKGAQPVWKIHERTSAYCLYLEADYAAKIRAEHSDFFGDHSVVDFLEDGYRCELSFQKKRTAGRVGDRHPNRDSYLPGCGIPTMSRTSSTWGINWWPGLSARGTGRTGRFCRGIKRRWEVMRERPPAFPSSLFICLIA